MEFTTHHISLPKGKAAHLFFLGDFHEGNSNVNHAAITRAVETISEQAKHGPTFWVSMGDTIDAIINSQDKRFNPSEIDRKYAMSDLKDLPRKQVDNLCKLLEPIKRLCICALAGNHEEEYIKRHSFDVYDYFASQFPYAYKLGYVGILRLAVESPDGSHRGAMLFDIHLNHGDTSSGTTAGAPYNKMAQLARHYDVDATIVAHTHRLKTDRGLIIRLNRPGTAMTRRVRWYGNSGCFLETYKRGNRNYFEHKGAPPSEIGMLHLKIEYIRPGNGHALLPTLTPIYLA
jgi:hypothetical protein